jgi:hypothetical protein
MESHIEGFASAVFRRTTKGQLAVPDQGLTCNTPESKLLMLVNGFTPLEYLSALAGIPLADLYRAAAHLVQRELVEALSPDDRISA